MHQLLMFHREASFPHFFPEFLPMRCLHALCLLLFACGWVACGETDSPPAKKPGTSTNGPDTGCTSSCVQGELLCADNATVMSCVLQSDGCYKPADPRRCEDDEICRPGGCIKDTGNGCTSTCDREDGPRCDARGQVVRCEDHDGEGCLTYGDATRCEAGTTCLEGACKAQSCQAACEVGTTRCEGERLQTCRLIEGCEVFSGGKECESGTTCAEGECKAGGSCESECAVGEVLCVPGDGTTFIECVDADGQGCGKYSEPAACGTGKVCVKPPGASPTCGAPLACPQTECTEVNVGCDGSVIKRCVLDTGGCLALQEVEDCDASGRVCDGSGARPTCREPKTTGVVVINEVFYDMLEDDVNGQGESMVFIELAGPPGFDITGYEIQLVNGSGGGKAYGTFTLPMNAKLNSDGLAVLSMVKTDPAFRFYVPGHYPLIPPYATGADGLQNGPDNVVLFDHKGAKIDALGYGKFGATHTFAGEGMPAQGVFPGHSVGRVAGRPDTGDNQADFVSLFPTPGLPNADLVINEAYVNQPGPDEVQRTAPDKGMSTFVEVSTPYYSFFDLELTGYVLRAINGSDGKDYLFQNMIPGIDFRGTKLSELSSTYAVVCHIDHAIDALLDKCSVPYDQAAGTGRPDDFQNGPDSLVLEYNGRVIDALGYGNFSGGAIFRGEGSSVALSSSAAGKSLNRRPVSDFSQPRDTDDNSKDFRLALPTPGGPNQAP